MTCNHFLTVTLALTIALGAPAVAQERRAVSFNSNGVPISYSDSGSGTPVVLIHGFTGSAERHWDRPGAIAALQQAGYRVIAMDCRGHGQSGKPRDPNQYGLEMVRDVVRLLDHLGVQRAHVVGYSMGGAIASQLLVKYPARLLTVTLLGSGWEGDAPQAITAGMLAMADGFDHRDASWLIRAVGPSGQSQMSDADVAAATADLFARNPPDILAAIARGMAPLYDVKREQLRASAVPLQAIVGDLDLNNLESVKRLAEAVPGLPVVHLPGATHASSVRPSIPHILAFLRAKS